MLQQTLQIDDYVPMISTFRCSLAIPSTIVLASWWRLWLRPFNNKKFPVFVLYFNYSLLSFEFVSHRRSCPCRSCHIMRQTLVAMFSFTSLPGSACITQAFLSIRQNALQELNYPMPLCMSNQRCVGSLCKHAVQVRPRCPPDVLGLATLNLVFRRGTLYCITNGS